MYLAGIIYCTQIYRIVEDMNNKDAKGFMLFGLYFPIFQSQLLKYTMITWIVMLLVLLISLTFFQYEMTNADLPCGALTGVLVAYLITLIVNW